MMRMNTEDQTQLDRIESRLDELRILSGPSLVMQAATLGFALALFVLAMVATGAESTNESKGQDFTNSPNYRIADPGPWDYGLIQTRLDSLGDHEWLFLFPDDRPLGWTNILLHIRWECVTNWLPSTDGRNELGIIQSNIVATIGYAGGATNEFTLKSEDTGRHVWRPAPVPTSVLWDGTWRMQPKGYWKTTNTWSIE